MAQYLTKPSLRRSNAEESQSMSATMTTLQIATQNHNVQHPNGVAEENVESAIYIFPAPASVPPSPATSSSVISVPTDITFTSALDTPSDIGSIGLWADHTSESSMGRPRTLSVDTGTGSEIDIEVWDMTGDERESGEHSTAELEAAIETANRMDALGRRPLDKHASLYISSSIEHGPKYLKQATLNSSWEQNIRLRPIPVHSLSKMRPRVAPQLPIRIRFLSFFSSLLSVDESTVNLLTRPQDSDSSPLFPGPQLLDIKALRVIDEVEHEKKTILLLGSMQPELQSLKEGMKIACDTSFVPLY